MLGKDELLHVLGQFKPEEEIRHILCDMIGCCPPGSHTTPPATTSNGTNPIVTVQGTVANDAFTFGAKIGASSDKLQDQTFQLDTGAFEILLTKAIGDALNLPNDGTLNISGVTGSSPAYKSHLTVRLIGASSSQAEWTKVPCVVDPSFTGTPLFGLRFFIGEKIALTLNPVTAELTLTHA